MSTLSAIDPWVLARVFGVCLIAGLVKGVAGMGFPTVILALLTTLLGLRDAMALMIVPAIATNVVQALVGGHLVAVLRRMWSLLITVSVVIWFSAGYAADADTVLLTGLLGVVLITYSSISLLTPQIPAPGRWEVLLSPLVGIVNGVVTGFTGSAAFPGVFYLQAVGLSRDALVQAMGLLFLVSLLALGSALTGLRQLSPGLGLISLLAIVPSFLGMAVGLRIRSHLSEARFRRVFFIGFWLLGLLVLLRALV